MFRLVLSKRFEKNLRTFLVKHPDLESVFQERLAILQKNPRDARLKTHKLTGKLKDFLGAWITYEYRLVFSLDKKSIFLLAIGSHDEVY